MEMCNCDLRSRSWNPQTGRCENCNRLFRDLRNGIRGGQGEGILEDRTHATIHPDADSRCVDSGGVNPMAGTPGTGTQQADADAEGTEEETQPMNSTAFFGLLVVLVMTLFACVSSYSRNWWIVGSALAGVAVGVFMIVYGDVPFLVDEEDTGE